jgi:hypothetical protein
MRDEMAMECASLSAAPIIAPMWCAAALNLSFAKPTVNFLAADKIVRNLLRRFPSVPQ